MWEWIKRIGRVLVAPLEFVTRYFKALLFLVIVVWIFGANEGSSAINETNLAEISLKGAILNPDSFLEELERIESLPRLAGVLLVVDSPGGAIAPSVEISEEIKRLSAKVPVVVYAQGVMASGGYYAGIWSKRIIANKGSLIGSIGVIFNGADVSELASKIGIKTQTIKAGKYKEAGTFMRPWNEDEEGEIKRLVRKQYEMFVLDVAEARGLDQEVSPLYAEGRVFSATEALELGLIDQIGIKSDAKRALEELSGVKESLWLQKEPWEKYMERWMSQATLQLSTLLASRIY